MFEARQLLERAVTAECEAAILRKVLADLRRENAVLQSQMRALQPLNAPRRIHPPMPGLIPAGDDFPERMQ